MAQRTASENQVETLARSRQWLEAALAIVARHREASIAAVAMLLVAYIQFNNSVFLSAPLMSVVTKDTARIGMIAAGIVLVMITGEIDLSVGATYAMAPYLMIRMNTDWEWSLWLAAPAAILIGVGVGCFNGLVTVKLRIPSLITTLGTFFLVQRGLWPEPVRSAGPALFVGRTNRIHAHHLDRGRRAGADSGPRPHRVWFACDFDR
jgi:ABC-type xylose transport system permease subunit